MSAEVTKTTDAAMVALLEEAMHYIKNRHNYGEQKRMEIRQQLLLRYEEMRDV